MEFKYCLPLLLLPLLEISSGCGDDAPEPEPEYTWGESVREVSDAYCEAIQRCAYDGYSDEQVDQCKIASYLLCEPDMTCDVDITDNARPITAECVRVLETYNDPSTDQCFTLYVFGQLPQACVDWFKLEPAPDEQ